MEKRVLDRRLDQMRAEGVVFKTNSHVGINVSVDELKKNYSAVLLAGGACAPRDLPVPGRELKGVYFAMDYLTLQNRRCEGDKVPNAEFISAEGKHVVIIGGGDTGADCLGTTHRQKPASIAQLEIMPHPPEHRSPNNPWPEWPFIFRTSSAHEEGGERIFSVSTNQFIGDTDGNLRELELVRVEMVREAGRIIFNEVPRSNFTLKCDLALLAMGFVGPEKGGMLEQLGVKFTDRNNVWRDANWMTSVPGIFTAGDMQHGQSLIVWAIAEGRSAARGVDQYLMGSSNLPAPL
jgi:glutamate synthase (NADPH/NADH) small chain